MANAEILQDNQIDQGELAATGLMLTAIAARAYTLQHNGTTDTFGQPLQAIVESGAHPVIGFGAAAATLITADVLSKNNRDNKFGNLIEKTKYVSALAAGTIANFTVEAIQDQTVGPDVPFYAGGHQFETVKDWLFALGGVTLAYVMSRKNQR